MVSKYIYKDRVCLKFRMKESRCQKIEEIEQADYPGERLGAFMASVCWEEGEEEGDES